MWRHKDYDSAMTKYQNTHAHTKHLSVSFDTQASPLSYRVMLHPNSVIVYDLENMDPFVL